MSNILFFPPPVYVRHLELKKSVTLKELCQQAGVECKASGRWVERRIEIVNGNTLAIEAESGSYGAVRIEMKIGPKVKRARMALLVLAYGVQDLVAKASISGVSWSKLRPPAGRPSTGKALTTAERQRAYRKRHSNS